MDHTAELLAEASEYCRLTGKSRATIATLVMNDGKFFDRIEAGGGFTMKTYQKVKNWFFVNHPAGTKRKPAITKSAASVNVIHG